MNPLVDEFWGKTDNSSHAAAQVASAIALLYSIEPNVPANIVRDRLRISAVDLGPPGFDTNTGWGRLDAYSLLRGEEWDVTIYGPTTVPPSAECTYTAVPEGGVPPYQWAWDVNGQQVMSGRSSSIPALRYPLHFDPSTIRIRIMDSFFYEVIDAHVVRLDEQGPQCPLFEL